MQVAGVKSRRISIAGNRAEALAIAAGVADRHQPVGFRHG